MRKLLLLLLLSVQINASAYMTIRACNNTTRTMKCVWTYDNMVIGRSATMGAGYCETWPTQAGYGENIRVNWMEIDGTWPGGILSYMSGTNAWEGGANYPQTPPPVDTTRWKTGVENTSMSPQPYYVTSNGVPVAGSQTDVGPGNTGSWYYEGPAGANPFKVVAGNMGEPGNYAVDTLWNGATNGTPSTPAPTPVTPPLYSTNTVHPGINAPSNEIVWRWDAPASGGGSNLTQKAFQEGTEGIIEELLRIEKAIIAQGTNGGGNVSVTVTNIGTGGSGTNSSGTGTNDLTRIESMLSSLTNAPEYGPAYSNGENASLLGASMSWGASLVSTSGVAVGLAGFSNALSTLDGGSFLDSRTIGAQFWVWPLTVGGQTINICLMPGAEAVSPPDPQTWRLYYRAKGVLAQVAFLTFTLSTIAFTLYYFYQLIWLALNLEKEAFTAYAVSRILIGQGTGNSTTVGANGFFGPLLAGGKNGGIAGLISALISFFVGLAQRIAYSNGLAVVFVGTALGVLVSFATMQAGDLYTEFSTSYAAFTTETGTAGNGWEFVFASWEMLNVFIPARYAIGLVIAWGSAVPSAHAFQRSLMWGLMKFS